MEPAMQFPFAKRVQLHIGYFSDASKPMYDYVVDVSQFVDLYSDSELCHHKGTHDYTLCSLLRASRMTLLLREFHSFMQESRGEEPMVLVAVAWVLGKLCEAYSCNVTMLHKQARHNSSKNCLSTCDLCKEDTAYKHRVGPKPL